MAGNHTVQTTWCHRSMWVVQNCHRRWRRKVCAYRDAAVPAWLRRRVYRNRGAFLSQRDAYRAFGIKCRFLAGQPSWRPQRLRWQLPPTARMSWHSRWAETTHGWRNGRRARVAVPRALPTCARASHIARHSLGRVT